MTPAPDATLSWAASAFVGLPTGSFKRGLGSALVDYGVNVMTQAHLQLQWQFEPPRLNGKPVAVRDTVPVRFALPYGQHFHSLQINSSRS